MATIPATAAASFIGVVLAGLPFEGYEVASLNDDALPRTLGSRICLRMTTVVVEGSAIGNGP